MQPIVHADRPARAAGRRLVLIGLVTGALVAAGLASLPAATAATRTWAVRELISVASDNTLANDFSDEPAVSADGRYVVFTSAATTLVPDDTNDMKDVFVRDRQTNTVERVSVAGDGTEANGISLRPDISGDGRYVVFSSAATNLEPGDTSLVDVFLRDRAAGTTVRVTNGVGSATEPTINADGSVVVYRTGASLDAGDSNGDPDIYAYDRESGTTTWVSVGMDGAALDDLAERPAVSADGRYVAFQSPASNLVDGDSNGLRDVFVRDLEAGTTERVSVTSDGEQAAGMSTDADISADGRWVVFTSYASNLVDGDSNGKRDVFVHDRATGTTERVSVASDGSEGTQDATSPSISDDGRFVTFTTRSALVADDNNSIDDVYMRDLTAGVTTRVSVGGGGASGGSAGRIAGDGRTVALTSIGKYVDEDENATVDVYVAGLLAPSNTEPPTIDGTPTVGQTLTVDPGEWDNDPTGFTWQWQRCDADGDNCADIDGATSDEYTLTDDDEGSTIRVVVTAANETDATQVTTAVTDVVDEPPPTSTTTPTPGAPPEPADLGPVETAVDPGCRYTAASADVASADGFLHGFAQFSGPGCANDGKIVYLTQPDDGGDGSGATTEVSPWTGRVLAVAATEYATFLLYVTPEGQIRITSRLADGTFTAGRPLVTLDAAKGRLVTGALAARGSEWRAVWSEGGTYLYEGRTLGGVDFMRHPVEGAYTSLQGTVSEPDLALRTGGQATLTFIGPDGRVWVAPTAGTVQVRPGLSTEGWATRAFELAPARTEGYSGPRVVVDGRFTYLAWSAKRANPGPWVTAADNTSGAWASKTFNTLGDRPRLVAEDGRVRVAWATAQAAGKPARVFIARRDTPVGAWAGEYASPEAITDQVPAAMTLADGLTTLVIRSSLRLYTRIYGDLDG